METQTTQTVAPSGASSAKELREKMERYLKMACDAENKGEGKKAELAFNMALKSEAQLLAATPG